MLPLRILKESTVFITRYIFSHIKNTLLRFFCAILFAFWIFSSPSAIIRVCFSFGQTVTSLNFAFLPLSLIVFSLVGRIPHLLSSALRNLLPYGFIGMSFFRTFWHLCLQFGQLSNFEGIVAKQKGSTRNATDDSHLIFIMLSVCVLNRIAHSHNRKQAAN